MRQIVRGVLWVVKGVLLVIALVAFVLWPWSYWHKQPQLNIGNTPCGRIA
jgi:hypothetical protein